MVSYSFGNSEPLSTNQTFHSEPLSTNQTFLAEALASSTTPTLLTKKLTKNSSFILLSFVYFEFGSAVSYFFEKNPVLSLIEPSLLEKKMCGSMYKSKSLLRNKQSFVFMISVHLTI